MSVHHYMVDFEDDAGNLCFANPVEITSLTRAKSLASKTSKTNSLGAYVVAFCVTSEQPLTYGSTGHISFFDGKQSSTDGIVR